jgi:hypothetical protein
LLHDVRRSALFRERVAMEAGIGWPIPGRRATAVHLRLPVFGFHHDRGETILYPPFGVLGVDYRTGVPTDYRELRYTGPLTPVGTFPHAAVRGPAGNYIRDRARLLARYDELCDALSEGTAFAAKREFGELLGRLVEPGLLPHYRALGREFYEQFIGPGPVGPDPVWI